MSPIALLGDEVQQSGCNSLPSGPPTCGRTRAISRMLPTLHCRKTAQQHGSPLHKQLCSPLLASSSSSPLIWTFQSHRCIKYAYLKCAGLTPVDGQSKIYGPIGPHRSASSWREPATGCAPNALKFKEVMKKLSRRDKNTSLLPQ